MESLKSKELKPLTFQKFLTTDSRSSIPYFSEFSALYSDVRNLHSFIQRYSKLLQKTPDAGSVNPLSNGLDGTTLYIDKIANAGPFFNKMANRPKTLSELLMEIVYSIDIKIQGKDIATEMQLIKRKIGISLFDPDMISDSESLSYKVNNLIKNMDQLSADVWNDDESIGATLDRTTYNLNGTGRQSQQYTIRQMLNQAMNQIKMLSEKVDNFILQNSNRVTKEITLLANEPMLLYRFDTLKFTAAQIQYKFNSPTGYIMGTYDVLYFPNTETMHEVQHGTISTHQDLAIKFTADKSGTFVEVAIQSTQNLNKYSLVMTLFE